MSLTCTGAVGAARRPATRRRVLAGALATSLAPLAACGPSGAFGTSGSAATGGDAGAPRPAGGERGAEGLGGKLLYVGDANVWVWEKGTTRRLTGDRVSRQPAWSPDGKQIAHVKIDVSSSELWLMDADGSNSRQLTQSYNPVLARNNWVFRPSWWPDGSRLLYATEEASNDLMVWQIGLDGKNRRPFLTVPDGEGGLDMPSVAPDAKRLVLISYRGPGLRSQVWTYGLPSGPFRQLTETAEGAYDPAWSPDGTRIAYVVRDKGRHDVWVMGADGSDARQVTDAGACRAPCWSPDGQYLAYLSMAGGAFDLWAVPAPAVAPAATGAAGAGPTEPRGTPKQLTRGASADAVSGLSWTK